MSPLRDHLPDLPRIAQVTIPGDLVRGDIILFYDYTRRDWLRSCVEAIDFEKVHLKALEGDLAGCVWRIDRNDITDPELYLKLLPNDP